MTLSKGEISIPEFAMQKESIQGCELSQHLDHPSCGATVQFEGWVRNHNQGKKVTGLEYEAYEDLCLSEAKKILTEAKQKWSITHVLARHRVGTLDVGECAVWVGVSSGHRREAFAAAAYVIDELKARIPVWKKEFYVDAPAEWVACHTCGSGHSSSPYPSSDCGSHHSGSCKA